MNFQNAVFLTSYGTTKQLPPSDRPEIVFAGKSNVGKSSLINKLLGRKALARVSATPGKTVTINFYGLENLHLADLPGYGYAKVARGEKRRWADLMEGYFNDPGRDIALVFQLLDMRHNPTADDLQMLDYLIENEFPVVCVLTKADKLSKSQQAKQLDSLKSLLPYGDQLTWIPFSSVTGQGVEELRQIITELSQDVMESVEDTETSNI